MVSYDVIIRPIITERSMAGAADKKYVFEVAPGAGKIEIKKAVEEIFVHDHLYTYMQKLVAATREHSCIELGVSPRGLIALTRMAKAEAFLEGRGYVIPEDAIKVFADVTKHRILLSARARVTHVTQEEVLDEILRSVTKPVSYRMRTKG